MLRALVISRLGRYLILGAQMRLGEFVVIFAEPTVAGVA